MRPGFRWSSKPPAGTGLNPGVGLNAGLAALWALNEQTGPRLQDLSGNGATATASGGFSWGVGPVLTTDGSTGHALATRNLINSGSYTLWARINLTTTALGANKLVFSQGTVADGTWIGVFVNTAAQVVFQPDGATNIAAPGALAAGTWYTIGLTYTEGKTPGTGSWAGYVNGAPVAGGTASPTYTGDRMSLGQSCSGNTAGSLPARWDVAGVWLRGLAAAEVQALHNDPYGPFLAPGLRRYYVPAGAVVFTRAGSGGGVAGGAAARSPAWSPAGSGGIIAAGPAPPAAAWSPAGSGGIITGGTAPGSPAWSPAGSGGADLGGAAAPTTGLQTAGSGGGSLGGTGATLPAWSPAASGGIDLGGAAAAGSSSFFTATAAGGVALGGASGRSAAFTPAAAAGLVLGGVALAAAPGATAPPALFRPALVAALRGNAALAGIVGGRIFPLHVPETQTLPALAFSVASVERQQNLDGPNGLALARVRYWCLSPQYSDTDALKEELRNLFDGAAGPLSGVTLVSARTEEEEEDYLRSPDDSDEGTYQLTFDLLYLYRESRPTLT